MPEAQGRARRVLPTYVKACLAVGSPVAFLGLLELALAVVGYGAKEQLAFYDWVPSRKRAGVVRICVVGGSAAAGWPFGPRGGPVPFLRVLLRDVVPGQRTEVYNCAVNALTSEGVALVARRLMAYEPDVLIVYSGHNEFFSDPALTRAVGRWEPRKAGWHRRTRAYALLQDVALLVRGGASAGGDDTLTRTERAEMGLLGSPGAFEPGKLALPLEARLREIVELAKGHGVAVVLSTLASNIRRVPPTKPVHRSGLTAEQLAAWRTAYHEGRALAKAGRHGPALAAFERAGAIDREHAGLLYELARCHDALGRHAAARTLFAAARDRDYMPMRATTPRNEAARRVAARAGVALADAEAAFADASPQGIPGDELLCDHVHLTLRGAMTLARCWARALQTRGMLGPGGGWHWPRARPLEACVQAMELGPRTLARAHVEVGTQCALAEAGGRRVDALRRPQLVEALRERGIGQLAAALRLDPQSCNELQEAHEPFTSCYLAWAWVAAGRPERAVAICQEVLDAAPEFALSYEAAADAHAACGNGQEAAAVRARRAQLTQGRNGGGQAVGTTPDKEDSP